jgi:hypothetical protein
LLYLPLPVVINLQEEIIMESYVERYTREKREAAQKEQKKLERKPKRQQKEVVKDGQTARGERHEAPEAESR